MDLNFPINLSRNSLNQPIILKIIPTKYPFLLKILVNLLINHVTLYENASKYLN